MPMLRTPTATALAEGGAYAFAAFRPPFQFRLLRSCGAGGSPAGKGLRRASGLKQFYFFVAGLIEDRFVIADNLNVHSGSLRATKLPGQRRLRGGAALRYIKLKML